MTAFNRMALKEYTERAAEELTQRGVHHAKTDFFEYSGRCCVAYLTFGMCSIVDIQVISVAKHYRRQGVMSSLLLSLFEAANEKHAIRFINVINPVVENFLIQLGFRLLGDKDYILMEQDITGATDRLNRRIVSS